MFVGLSAAINFHLAIIADGFLAFCVEVNPRSSLAISDPDRTISILMGLGVQFQSYRAIPRGGFVTEKNNDYKKPCHDHWALMWPWMIFEAFRSFGI
jgi:hypothetical protein